MCISESVIFSVDKEDCVYSQIIEGKYSGKCIRETSVKCMYLKDESELPKKLPKGSVKDLMNNVYDKEDNIQTVERI